MSSVSAIPGVSAHSLLCETTREQGKKPCTSKAFLLFCPYRDTYGSQTYCPLATPSTPERAQVGASQKVSRWWPCRKLAYNALTLAQFLDPGNQQMKPPNHPHPEDRPYTPWVFLLFRLVSPRVNPEDLPFPSPRQQ